MARLDFLFGLPIYISLFSLSVSILSFVIAIKGYRRKQGVYVRGVFSTTSSVDCDDIYISEVVLENLKDRAVTIFGIYLRLGYNYYVQLEQLEDKPFVLRAFETSRWDYGPIQFYGVNNKRIALNNLLASPKTRKQIVLSTADGRYRVPLRIRRWNPIADFFRNHMTGVIRPVRLTHEGKHIGGNIAYVVELIMDHGEKEVVLIHPRDYEIRIFARFSIPRDALSSKKSLERLLQKQMNAGNLPCKSFMVHDSEQWRQRNDAFYDGGTVQAARFNAFQYFVIGRLLSRFADWKLNRENARTNRSTKQKEEKKVGH